MSTKGYNQSGFERKRAKQAEHRRPHIDKYAAKASTNRLAALAEHSKSEERADERA